jgi:23S rRNA U2552 (ribose-2'-O)-methylase RlmE/FtsJ
MKNNNKIYWLPNKSENLVHFQDLLDKCHEVMSQIDHLDSQQWHFYRKLLNPYDFSSRKIAVNRAFYKLWEIFKVYPFLLNNCKNSLSLCESPGSFIQVINKFNPNCHMTAISKPKSLYSDVVKSGKCIPLFHKTVLQINNAKFFYIDIYDTCRMNMILDRKYDFISADGGFDENKEYNKKEILHLKLILAQVVYILNTQSLHGNCVLKLFDTFTENIVHTLFLLTKHYTTIEFFKPSTSRSTNSERYIICNDFQGSQYSQQELIDLLSISEIEILFSKTNLDVPQEFSNFVFNSSKDFTIAQINSINKVFHFIKQDHSIFEVDQLYNNKRNIFKQWIQEFDLCKK